jgi:transposase
LVVAWQRGTTPVRTGTFPNTPEGHATLLRAFTPHTPIQVVMEATGHWHLDLAWRLSQTKGLSVMVANPRATCNFAKARLQRAKTDAVDAENLLQFCQHMPFHPWTPPSLTMWQFRAVMRHLAQLVQELARLKNQQKASQSTAQMPECVKESLAQQVKQQTQWIETCEGEAQKLLEADPTLLAWWKVLCTIPGIGERSGMQLLGELAFLDSGMTPDQVVAYAGLDPRPRQSGTRDPRRRISKAGNRRLRGILYMPMLTAVRWNPPLKAWYEKLRAAQKPTFVAQVAVMRRLLRIAWAMLKQQTPWDAERAEPRTTAHGSSVEGGCAEISAPVT